MTIEKYFEKPQDIDSTIINEIYYKKTATVEFEGEMNRRIRIFIAHPDKDMWSFGWKVHDGESAKRTHTKECVSSVVTKGNIGNLLFGVLKAIDVRLGSKKSKAMSFLLKESQLKAYKHYIHNRQTEHVTL